MNIAEGPLVNIDFPGVGCAEIMKIFVVVGVNVINDVGLFLFPADCSLVHI